MSLIAEHWSQLSGSVHPDDQPVFAAAPRHSFHLRFPPPAFIGSPDAPIVFLMSNGGYAPGVTEAEFPTQAAVDEFVAYLRGRLPGLPSILASYYQRGQVGAWIESGDAVLVNAVPYRSPSLSNERHNWAVAEALPSRRVHRAWLVEEVLPAARAGERFVFVHRNRWWGVPQDEASDNVVFSDPARAEPNRAAPDASKLARAAAWLAQRRPR